MTDESLTRTQYIALLEETIARLLARVRDDNGEITSLRAELATREGKVETLEQELRTIAEFPIPEQDNMIAANMRIIAGRALNQTTRAAPDEGGE